MAMNNLALAYMRELDNKYKDTNINWGNLPHDHPDIVKLQSLNPLAAEPVVTRVWTDEEETFLRESYKRFSDKELGEHLNFSGYAIMKKRLQMGLYKHKSMKRE